MRFRAEVEVFLKPGLLDPQGKAVELELEAADREAATAEVREIAERLLSNPVIERFELRDVIELVGGNGEVRA